MNLYKMQSNRWLIIQLVHFFFLSIPCSEFFDFFSTGEPERAFSPETPLS